MLKLSLYGAAFRQTVLVVWLDEGTKTYWSGLGKDHILVYLVM